LQLKVVLVKEDSPRSELLRRWLLDCGHEISGEIVNLDQLLDYASTGAPELVLIDSHSPDDSLLIQLQELTTKQPLPVILCTDQPSRDKINQAFVAGVSGYLVGTIDQSRLAISIDIAIARFRETARLRQELQDAKNRLVERKAVERAKGILMKQRGFDEPQAFHALRKMAMDRNLRIGQVAENIIAVTELLN
jgi:response regulator NasT